MVTSLISLRDKWQDSCLGTESTLHQLAPYIGKLKTSIARSLLSSFSDPGDIVLDPFCGSGVVPLEALLMGRGAIANDLNPYAATLTRAKLFPIPNEVKAIQTAILYVDQAKKQAKKVHYSVYAPDWVRAFFHPHTLAEVKILANMLKRDSQWFLLANLLGILHHQRPGFLSYPASHLVPYLRVRKFPPRKFPELYAYRDVNSCLVRKLGRTYRRFNHFDVALPRVFTAIDVRQYRSNVEADIVLTSPPYMNALDYGRDNRLRLWFLGCGSSRKLDAIVPRGVEAFSELMRATAFSLKPCVKRCGLAILVVGEVRRNKRVVKPDGIVKDAFEDDAGGWRLTEMITDPVPDIRRSRRGCSATKKEWIMVFKRS